MLSRGSIGRGGAPGAPRAQEYAAGPAARAPQVTRTVFGFLLVMSVGNTAPSERSGLWAPQALPTLFGLFPVPSVGDNAQKFIVTASVPGSTFFLTGSNSQCLQAIASLAPRADSRTHARRRAPMPPVQRVLLSLRARLFGACHVSISSSPIFPGETYFGTHFQNPPLPPSPADPFWDLFADLFSDLFSDPF